MKLTFKSPEIVVRAVKAGLTVYWRNTGYRVTEGMQIVHHSGSSEGAHWPPHDMSKIFAYVSQDTEDFLTTLLFCNEPEDWDEDEDEPPFNADMHNRTIYDFAPEFVAAVEAFISGFRETLGNTDLDMLSRSFGGNVFLSLSGHGAGFWDDSHPMGRVVHDLLVAYSGDGYRFEQLYVSNDESGLLDMSFIPSAREEYRNKTFKLL